MFRLLLIFFTISCFASEKQTICLNMIVKNEAPIIRRCLDSVKGIIDYWVIMDTGSTDGTQEIIQAHMADIPGELVQSDWKNWGETRSEAFDLAMGKADYILFMDADDVLEFDSDFEMPELTEDLYTMWRGTDKFCYLKPQIVRADWHWQWVGVTHEYLHCDFAYSQKTLEGIHYTSIDDGATRCTGVAKYLKNVALLEEGLKKEPQNERYAFYLAESYRDSEQPAKALEWYQKRIKMGGWAEEIYWAKLQIGHMLTRLGLPTKIIIEAYKDAYDFRPYRVEALYHLVQMYNNEHEYAQAYEYLKKHTLISKPSTKDTLFNETWIEDYGLLFQMTICSYYVGKYDEAVEACDTLLLKEALPSEWKELVAYNRTFPVVKLEEIHCLSNQKGLSE